MRWKMHLKNVSKKMHAQQAPNTSQQNSSAHDMPPGLEGLCQRRLMKMNEPGTATISHRSSSPEKVTTSAIMWYRVLSKVPVLPRYMACDTVLSSDASGLPATWPGGWSLGSAAWAAAVGGFAASGASPPAGLPRDRVTAMVDLKQSLAARDSSQ